MRTHLLLIACAILLSLSGIGRAAASNGVFQGDVVAKWLPNGREMELTEAFAYVDARGTKWDVPKGAVVDGASIPRALWTVIGAPFTGKYRKASVVHDYHCARMTRPWQDVHQALFNAALAEGSTPFHAKLMYGAVYAWGPRWEIIAGTPIRTREVVRAPSEKDLQDMADWIKAGDPPLQEIAAFARARFPRSTGLAEKRVALVIGNAAYRHTPRLTNPANDAADMAAVLRLAGFDVTAAQDLTKAGMDRTLSDFATKLTGADVGAFFYAGHGLQVGGQNYLVPVDAQLKSAASLDFEMVRLDLVHRTMERETKTNILFVDACRDNPLAGNLARAMGTRSAAIGRGLAATESGIGTLINFSTQPGNVAVDGAGRNSPFAASLVKRVRSAGAQDISTVLIDVRNDVMAATQNKQVPWEHSALRARFYFTPPAAQAAVAEKPRGDAPKPASAGSAALYDSLMRRILAQKLEGVVSPADKGKDNYYRTPAAPRAKSMAACIDWERSTPHRLEYRGYSFASGEKSQLDADERALSQCYRATRGCTCTIIDRSDANAIVFPALWAERHRAALGKQ